MNKICIKCEIEKNINDFSFKKSTEKYNNIWMVLPVEGGNKMQVLHWTRLECLGYRVTRWEPAMQMTLL